MEALWPDATLRRAAERLSTCVANLRAVIRTAATHNATPDRRIEPVLNSGGHYRLNPDIVTVDWWTLHDEHTQATTTDGSQLRHLQAAITVSRGPLADGTDYEWIETDRETVRRQQLKLYTDTAALLADTNPHDSHALLDRACTIDPLNDDLARRAMRAAATIGDTTAVHHRLHLLHQALHDAGITPDPATDDLAATLLHNPA
jgi:DNA-binding SARP family transcriptional activator